MGSRTKIRVLNLSKVRVRVRVRELFYVRTHTPNDYSQKFPARIFLTTKVINIELGRGIGRIRSHFIMTLSTR